MIKFDVAFEIPRLRFADVNCVFCDEKFDAMEHGKTEGNTPICDRVDLQFGKFRCPTCGGMFRTRERKIEINET